MTKRIEFFDKILKWRLDITKIVNKVKTKDYKMSDNQKLLMIQRMQYLRCAYHNLLECDVDHIIKLSDCCERAIKQMETVGVK